MKRVKAILLLFVLLLGAFLTSCESGAAKAQRMIDEATELIPEFTLFYEENEEFFDLLLDIQERLRGFYADGETVRDFSVQFFLRLDGENDYRPFDISWSNSGNTRLYTFSDEELQLIEIAIRDLDKITQGHTTNVLVRNDRIYVVSSFNSQLFIGLGSPVMHNWEWSGPRVYSYSRNHNDNWSFYVTTTIFR